MKPRGTSVLEAKTGIEDRGAKGGFTLIELMVATVVFMVAVGTLLALLGRNEKAREVSYAVIEARQNARAGLEFVARDLRMAGSGLGVPVTTSTAGGDSMILHAVTPDSVPNRSEAVTILGAMTGVGSKLSQLMATPSSDLKVMDSSEFSPGDLVVVTNGAFANMFEVTNVISGTHTLEHATSSSYNQPGGHHPWPPAGYGTGSDVYLLDLVRYYIDRSDTANPMLARVYGTGTPAVISEAMDSLLFTYVLPDTVTTEPSDPTLIREVIVLIRTKPDQSSEARATRLESAIRPRCL
jgi:type II secretory pathway pseudopilin PulG